MLSLRSTSLSRHNDLIPSGFGRSEDRPLCQRAFPGLVGTALAC
jgi:hypothetical protein